MKATKKVLSLILAVMMVFSGVTVAFADETDDVNDVNDSYTVSDTEDSVTSDLAPDTDVSVDGSAEATATPVPTAEPTATPVPTVEPTATPAPTAEPTATPEATATPDADGKITEEQLAKLNELIATAKDSVEYKGTNHTLSDATEEIEEIIESGEIAELTSEEAEKLIEEYSEIVDNYTVIFTKMNIPYSVLFAAYTGSNKTLYQQDVVTTATTNKFKMTEGLAKGTYNDGTNICGVNMVVRMFKLDYEKIKANENQSGDYGFTVIESTKRGDYEYMTLTVNDDGSYNFKPKFINLANNGLSIGEFTTTSSYGDYQITVLGASADGSTCGQWSDVTYYGVILKTEGYKNCYAMYALDNLWFGSRGTNGLEIAWSVVGGQGLTNHGGKQFYQYDLNGAHIVQVSLLTSKGVINIGTNLQLTPYYTGDISGVEVSAPYGSNELSIAGVPEDLKDAKVTVTYKVGSGRGSKTYTIADNAEIVDGKVQLTEAIDGYSYVVKINSSNYCDVKVATIVNGVADAQVEKLNSLIGRVDTSEEAAANAVETAKAIVANPENYTSVDAKAAIDALKAYAPVYVTMNIPYSVYYAAYGYGSAQQQDVVTTATKNKFNMTTGLAKGTYNDGTNICGVTAAVSMSAEDYAKISANENQTGDYGFTQVDSLSDEYLTLTVDEENNYNFTPSKTEANAEGLSIGEVTTDTSYGDYQITVLGAKGDGSTVGSYENVTFYGAVLGTEDGAQYAMYALDGMWFSNRTTGLEIAWSVVGGQGLTNHGGNKFYQYDMNGKKLTSVTLLTSVGVINVACDEQLLSYYTGDVSELSAKIDTASTEVEVTGVPSDLTNPKLTITYSAGRHDTRTVVKDAAVVDGKVQLESAIEFGQNYVIKLTSDNYAQITVPYTQVTDLKAVTAYESTFYVADLKNLRTTDAENVTFRKTVNGRGGSTVTEYAYSEMTALDGTTFVYTGATALEGNIYAYTNKKALSYSTIYTFLGADVSDEYSAEVDVVSSATNYSSYHAKDIPTLVNFGTNADGNKVITGVSTARSYVAVDALTYLKAYIKSQFGYELSDEETALVDLKIKSNPASAPKSYQEVELSTATYASSKYGTGEFQIVPNDTVEGYNWNEYLNNIYAVTISNGDKTIGAVHWIDIYGENSTSGYHYNKLEVALNNGKSVGKNEADVTRFADFYDSVSGKLLAGDYTITVYAKGYDDLIANVTVTGDDANVIDLTTVKEMTSTSIAGQTYYYMTVDENTKYGQTVVTTGRGPSATTVKTDYAIADLTNVEGTNIYYYCANPVTGTVYSFTKNDAVSYKDIYGENVTLDVDVVSSATNISSFHAKDISDVVSYGTDENGNKVITGVSTEKTYTENDAAAYVTAMLKKAAGVELTEEETALTALTLKANPTAAPSESTVEVKLSKVEYVDSRYGVGEFDIVPDDTVEGYVWNEYWNNVYGATISNGTETVGTVHWIDLYGENSTSGYHYNKIQLALNNGESVGANKANVTRFASFLDSDNNLKPGTYTITIKSVGYTDLVATYTVPKKDQSMTVKTDCKTFTRSTTANKTANITVSDAVGKVTYKSSNSKYVTVSSKGVVTIKKGAPAGKYTVTVTAAGDDTYNSQKATVTYTVKKAQSMTVKADSTSFKRSTTANKYAHLTVSKAVGKVTYTSSNSKYVTVSSKGVVTIKKGAPKGTYKITVKAAGNSTYGSATKTVTIKVK